MSADPLHRDAIEEPKPRLVRRISWGLIGAVTAVLSGLAMLVFSILLAAFVDEIAPDSVVAMLAAYASIAFIQMTYEGGAHIIIYEAASGFATAFLFIGARSVPHPGGVIRLLAAWTAGWMAGGTIAGLFELLFRMVPGLIPVAILSLMTIRFQDDSLPVRIMDYGLWMGLICLTGAFGGFIAARILFSGPPRSQRKQWCRMAAGWGFGWTAAMVTTDLFTGWFS
jgi:hypothetical protein